MRQRISALVVLAAISVGCGSDEEPRPATQGLRTTSSPSLDGTYERRLTRADIERTDALRDETSANQDKPRPAGSSLRSRKAR